MQSHLAIGSGGLVGLGLGESKERFHFLPGYSWWHEPSLDVRVSSRPEGAMVSIDPDWVSIVNTWHTGYSARAPQDSSPVKPKPSESSPWLVLDDSEPNVRVDTAAVGRGIGDGPGGVYIGPMMPWDETRRFKPRFSDFPESPSAYVSPYSLSGGRAEIAKEGSRWFLKSEGRLFGCSIAADETLQVSLELHAGIHDREKQWSCAARVVGDQLRLKIELDESIRALLAANSEVWLEMSMCGGPLTSGGRMKVSLEQEPNRP
jgi:hypothetical protein